MMRRNLWLLALGVLVGCGNSDPATTAQPEGVAGPGGISNHEVHESMLDEAHLVDVDHHGLFIDFGTPAQTAYTFGDFRSGWGRKAADGDTTFSFVGQRGRIYFHADAAEQHVVRVRIKPIGTAAMTPYINNEQLQSVQLGAQGAFNDVDIVLPANKVRVGENYVLLTFGGTTPIAGADVAAAVDSVRIVRGTSVPAGEYAAPLYDARVRTVSIGGSERRAFVSRRPTTASWYVHVPARGRLGFGVAFDGQGTAPVKVFASAEGIARTQVFSHAANGTWKDANVDLTRFAGQPVRLEFVVEGSGAGLVSWSVPAIYTPTQQLARTTPARNVIVLLIDTLRADKMHPWNPRSRVRTPTIDALAQQGTIFELAHSVENWTKPSVASVLTGLYPQTHLARAMESELPAGALMLSEHLKAKGFTTSMFGANGYVSDRFGFNQGWDHYTNFIRENKNTDAENVFLEAGNWIEANKSQRFFTYIHTIDPHVPYDPPSEYLRMYDARADYAGIVQPRMTGDLLEQAKRRPPTVTFNQSDVTRLTALHDGEITQHDAVFGRFLERLRTLGVLDNTLIVITSDHGEEFNEHESWGHGHSVYEELLHVPLLVRLPGAVPANQRIAQAVGTLSIPATVTDLVGVEAMPNLEGPSLLPLIKGGVSHRPPVAFSDWTDDRRVVTVGRWKFVVRGNLTASFFDLEADPGERQQLDVTSHPVAQRYCRIMLAAYSGATNRARWLEAEPGQGVSFQQRNAVMDETIRAQLRALGYAQ